MPTTQRPALLHQCRTSALKDYPCNVPHAHPLYRLQYQSYVWNTVATHRLRHFGGKVVTGDLLLRQGSEVVEVVKGEPKDESIFTVVLPMPGTDVRYPDNATGLLYKEILEKDGVKFDKDAPDDAKAKGSYRRLVVKASNLSHEVTPTDSTTNMKLSFDLPSGSYATMLLRELMLTTVVRKNEADPDTVVGGLT